MKFGKIEVLVDGEMQLLDVDSELCIVDIDSDMDRVAAQMAFWGELQGQAESQKVMADTNYRLWKAQIGETILSKESKMAEWKVKQKIEASGKFGTYKEKIAKAVRNTVVLRAIFLAFQSKASMLQSRGARARAEMEATGMSTKSAKRADASAENRQAQKDKVREIMKKRKHQ
jgi:CRISPR/Cas system CMR-associated protein Cmr5 small subunit